MLLVPGPAPPETRCVRSRGRFVLSTLFCSFARCIAILICTVLVFYSTIVDSRQPIFFTLEIFREGPGRALAGPRAAEPAPGLRRHIGAEGLASGFMVEVMKILGVGGVGVRAAGL